ncbi:MAG: urate hydroxylase PuuD [Polyangia bacterium]|jgi:uncharacterized membrane protein
MDALFSVAAAALFVRWAHVIFGVIWLGHLYFFNLVNVPFQADLDKELKPKVNPKLLLRAFYWFRWSAMYTLILGLVLFGWHYMGPEHLMKDEAGHITGRAEWIQFGMLLGIIMWFNVWFVIWPRQKKILGGLASGTPHPDAAKLAATAGKASRFNTFASGPLLFAMLGAPHFAVMNGPVLIGVIVIGVGFWFGMIKRSFKIKTTAP